MLTVAERVARSGRDVAYVLFLEGVPWAFADREELCGSGGFSWIGVDNGEREVLPGLTVPETMESSTNLETGMLEGNDGLTFTVVDFDRKMIAYLRSLDAEAELVSEHLSPKTSPAPATLISADGQSDVAIHGKWLSHEAIGPDGERRIFQLFPGDPLPGYDHAAINSDVQDIGPSPVYAEPTHFVGRKCALYRVFRDTTSNQMTYPNWGSMSESFDSGYGLIWVGTVEEMSAEGTTWKIACNGPSAHLCKPLNVNRPFEWTKVRTILSLKTTPGERQDLIALACYYVGVANGTVLEGGSSIFDPADDVLPATGPLSDILSTVQARLLTITAAAGPDVTWTTTYQAEATFVYGYATAKVNSANAYVGAWDLCMHELVWKALGYDPKVQQKDGAYKDAYRIDFHGQNPDGQVPLGAGWWTCPGPGYYVARFSTIPVGFSDRADAGTHSDNDGQTRVWYAINDSGVSLVFPGARQELDVGIGVSPFIEGQFNRPPDEHTFSNGGGDADSTGYFVLRGQYRESADEDPIEMAQVFKGSWRNLAGTYGEDDLSVRQLYISRWIDPRFFGIDRKPLDRVWAVAKGGLAMVPIAFLGYNLDAGDRADLVLLRLLLATGTASWTGYEGQNAARTLGDNADPDAAFDEGSDVELADLGLGVYHALVDAKSFTNTAKLLPGGGGNSPLNA